jgi:hypothetical protein
VTDQQHATLESVRERLRGTAAHRAVRWLRSSWTAVRHRAAFAGVETYCVFLGHSRSGHSIVGALLDAHPNIVISDELDALDYLARGFGRERIMALSLLVSADQARRQRVKRGRSGATYSYAVPNQFQGRYRDLRVVGDSRAGWSTRRLVESPGLLDELTRTMAPSAVRFIHVVRNPFDNVSTMMLRAQRSQADAIGRYFEGCDRLAALRTRIPPSQLHLIRHEALIDDPETILADACRFLGVEPDERHIAACAAVLYRAPSRSREAVTWSPDAVADVEARIGRYEFLSGYRFDA